MALTNFETKLNKLEIEGVSVSQYFPARGSISVTKYVDYPTIGNFQSDGVEILLNSPNRLFDPGAVSGNFFTQRGLDADGLGAEVLLEVTRGTDSFFLAGEIVEVRQKLETTVATIIVKDLSNPLRRSRIENFGETIERRITDLEDGLALYEDDNPVFQFPRWGVPIVPGSVTLTTTPAVTIVDSVATTGTLSKTNVEIDYRNGRIRFEATPDAGDGVQIDATWKIDYRYKRPDALVRLLLDNLGISDKINITNDTNAAFAIERSLVKLDTPAFSNNGRPYFRDEGVSRWIMEDTTNGDTWFAQDNALIRYDQALDTYEKVGTIPDDSTITAIPPGTYGNRVTTGDVVLRPPVVNVNGTNEYPRIEAIAFSGSYIFAIGMTSDSYYRLYRFDSDGTNPVLYYSIGGQTVTARGSSIIKALDLATYETTTQSYVVYCVADYDVDVVGTVEYTGNYKIYQSLTTHDPATETVGRSQITENGLGQQGFGVINTPHIEDFRFTFQSDTVLWITTRTGRITHAGRATNTANFIIQSSTTYYSLGRSVYGLAVDSSYLYATDRGTPSVNDRIRAYAIPTSVTSGSTLTPIANRAIDISGLPSRNLYAPGWLTRTGNHLFVSQETTALSMQSIYAIAVGNTGNYHAFAIFQFDTTDFENFYCLVSNTFKADGYTDTVFNRNRMMRYDKSADTWTTLLDQTLGQPQIALQTDSVSAIRTVGDNRKQFQVLSNGGKLLVFYRFVTPTAAGVRFFNVTDHTMPPPATQATITMPGVAANNSLKIALPPAIDTSAVGTGGNDWSVNVVRRLLRGDTSAATQAYVDVYQPGSTTLGFRVTFNAATELGANGNNRIGYSISLIVLQGQPAFTWQQRADVTGRNMTLRMTATQTITQIVTSINTETDWFTASLIPGTNGATVMGTGQTSAQLFGSQAYFRNFVYFHSGANPVPAMDQTRELTIDIANKELDLRVHAANDSLNEIRDTINATTGFQGAATATGTSAGTTPLHGGYFGNGAAQTTSFSGGVAAPAVTTLVNVYSETPTATNGVPYGIDFVLDIRTDGIHVYTFVVKRVITGSTFTSATLTVYRKRVRPDGTQSQIFTETWTGTAGTDEYPVNVSDIILADDRSKFYFVLDYYSESTTERGKSEWCTIAKDGSGTRKVLMTFDDPAVGPRSPAKWGSRYFTLQGNWYRNLDTDFYPNMGGKLLEVTTTDTVTDHGIVWRSGTRETSPDPMNSIYDGWGLHSAITSNLMVDSRGNLNFIAGYGSPYRQDNNLPGVALTNTVGSSSNFVWIQWGTDLSTKIPIFPAVGKVGWAAVLELAELTDSEIGFGPRTRKVESIQNTDSSITDWQGYASLFYRPRTALPGKLRAAINATANTFGINDQDLPGADSEFPAPGTGNTNHVIIGTELIGYTGVTSDTNGVVLTGVTRGQHGSTAAAHSLNDDVYFVDRVIRTTDPELINIQSKSQDTNAQFNLVTVNYQGGSHEERDTASINRIGERQLVRTVPLQVENLAWVNHIGEEYLDRFKALKSVLHVSMMFDPKLELGQLIVVQASDPFLLDYEKFQVVRVRQNLSDFRTLLILRSI